MKKTILSLLAFAVAGGAWAQSYRDRDEDRLDDDYVRKIEVVGNAEEEVTPNEIYFSITLKEYEDEGNRKVSIDKLERDLYSAVRKIGVQDEDFQVMDVAGYNYDRYVEGKRQDREAFLASKQYRVTFEDLDEINRLFEYLDPKAIQSTNVTGYSHTDIENIKSELKVDAIRNAREKAETLLRGINESLGEVLEVEEISNDYQPPVMYARSMEMAQSDGGQPNIDFKKITLKAQVRAVFRIRN